MVAFFPFTFTFTPVTLATDTFLSEGVSCGAGFADVGVAVGTGVAVTCGVAVSSGVIVGVAVGFFVGYGVAVSVGSNVGAGDGLDVGSGREPSSSAFTNLQLSIFRGVASSAGLNTR